MILTLRAPPCLLDFGSSSCLFSCGEELSVFLLGDKCVAPIFLRNLFNVPSICCSSLGSCADDVKYANSADPFCSLSWYVTLPLVPLKGGREDSVPKSAVFCV
jgi:hypothetical protein